MSLQEYLIPMPPARVADLGEVEAAADCYVKRGAGYELRPEAVEAINEANAEIERVWNEGHAKLAEKDKAIERKSAAIVEMTKAKAVRETLTKAGVEPRFIDVAIPLIVKTLPLVVEGETVTADGQSLELAVAQFLNSETGAFVRPMKTDGPFAAEMRRLRNSAA
jgi:hypothetical protein